MTTETSIFWNINLSRYAALTGVASKVVVTHMRRSSHFGVILDSARIRQIRHYVLLVRLITLPVVIALLISFEENPQSNARRFVETNDPYKILAEANRLSWLMNSAAAAPLYRRAEGLFHGLGDRKSEAYAHVGGLAAQADSMSRAQLSELLSTELESPTVRGDEELRLRCLFAKATVDVEYKPRSAKKLWEEALAIAQKLNRKDWATRIEGALGLLSMWIDGDRLEATKLFGSAFFASMFNGDTAGQMQSLGILGNALNETQRYSEAMVLFDRALKLARQNPDIGFPYLTHEGKAEALMGQAKLAESQRILDQALAVAEAEGNGTHESGLRILLGRLKAQRGDPESAIRELQRAAQIASRLDLYRMQAGANLDLANLYTAKDSLSEAAASLKIALSASHRLGDIYFPPKLSAALATLNAKLGNLSRSDSFFRQAEGLLDKRLKGLKTRYWETGVRAALGDSYIQHFKLAMRKGNISDAFTIIERVRSNATVLGPDSVSTSSDQSIDRQIADVQFALMQSQALPSQSDLEEKLGVLEQHFALDSDQRAMHQAATIQPASLRAIQRILHNDEEILEFVLDEPVSFCIIITHPKAVIVALEGGKAKIEALAEDYIARIRTRRPVSALGAYLYSTLLPKSLPLERLIIVPDGKLSFLPFESLIDAGGGFLLQSHIVSYASSSTLLRSLRTARTYRKPHRALLAMGGIPYEPNTNAVPESSRGLERLFGNQLKDLPNTGQEASAISKLFPGKTTLLLGTQATETAFKRQSLHDFKILHLAVHAVADDQFPDRAALVLARDKDSDDDGLLQAREITRLRLNADLVTLSACETALGKLEGREGVRGLKEAFLTAGAHSVVASLWNVEDQSTTRLMVGFYKHLSKGEDEATALKNAKLDFMRDNPGAAPFYWAGFIIAGEGFSQIGFSSD